MSVSYWQQQGHSLGEFDIAIIGAGITGLSVAYWLEQRDPNLRIAILEKGSSIGAGASGRNAGFITCGSVEHFNRMVEKHGEAGALQIWRFAEENMRLLKEHIVGGIEEKIDFEQHGTFSLATQDNEMSELEEVSRLMNQNNVQTKSVTAKELTEKMSLQGFVGGIHYIQDGAVHPVKLCKAISDKISASIFMGTEAHSVEEQAGERKLNTNKGSIRANLVISALNGYSAQLYPYFREKIYPTRGQMLLLEPGPRFLKYPCYANFYLDYFRQLKSGHFLIGGFRQLEKETEVGYSDHTTEKIQDAFVDFISNHLPQLSSLRVTHRWSGIMGFSSDGEPMLGALATDPQTFYCGGFTGHGLGLSFHAAKVLVGGIFGEPIPDWISAQRF